MNFKGCGMRQHVYRNLDQAELDREYNAAAHVGETRPYFDDYNARSAAARASLLFSPDIPYGSEEGETLDIFFQSRSCGAPIHVFFHGGGYRSQDKYNFSFVAGPLVERGAVVVIPNYGLCPAVSLDDIVAQTRRSIAWVHRHARVMGGDPNAITISGHSAGAHIVARALEACWDDHGAPDDVIKAAMSLSGIYDQEARRLSFLNQYLRLDQAQSLRNSSMFRTPRRRVPYVIAVAEHETGEYIRQSRDYAQALQGRSYDATYLEVRGKNHYDILDAFLDFSHPLGHALHEQVFKGSRA
jgi:arylformamidase